MVFHFFNPGKNKKAHKKLQAAKYLITIPDLYIEKIEKYKRIAKCIASQDLQRRDVNTHPHRHWFTWLNEANREV